MGMQTLKLDVTDVDNIAAAVEHIEKAEGRVDVLVCNAGVDKAPTFSVDSAMLRTCRLLAATF